MKRIMIVDDSRTTRKLVAALLEQDGYQVDSASNGIEALEALFRSAYDLVIIDIDMPQMDGFELLRSLKADGVYQKVPIILLTAEATCEEVARGLSLGAREYLVKPVLLGKLSCCVRRILADESQEPCNLEERDSSD
ncbi:MAG: response regulator [Firmicutes bacterium]|nr:response regulator [Bacillota bacterium]